MVENSRQLRQLDPQQQKSILIDYLIYKVSIEDWHAVADVACDIRELESKFPQLKSSHKPG